MAKIRISITVAKCDWERLRQKAEAENKNLSQYLVDRGLSEEITISNLFKRRK